MNKMIAEVVVLKAERSMNIIADVGILIGLFLMRG
jgi:hypothetical protein